ncbi:uncharacterized protein CTHT_0043180 [Thermochaetoides thermophila DSM 1495]|uniref:Uncharacterized protein n=1 Tax=Chaetomium thermophilum (strain DSM 1495 / CBS 144.50 / IMI 039719) TaxID=759272 RepID=G0SAR1_CHATD|nr:hypothetical protein CTHT_0043180 [Thermochaetoides thermophila DSM 1495]EGS19833.1 hypothetical protein CTHT_0043180 [Thermochaetoides thermophila DSM 1495]
MAVTTRSNSGKPDPNTHSAASEADVPAASSAHQNGQSGSSKRGASASPGERPQKRVRTTHDVPPNENDAIDPRVLEVLNKDLPQPSTTELNGRSNGKSDEQLPNGIEVALATLRNSDNVPLRTYNPAQSKAATETRRRLQTKSLRRTVNSREVIFPSSRSPRAPTPGREDIRGEEGHGAVPVSSPLSPELQSSPAKQFAPLPTTQGQASSILAPTNKPTSAPVSEDREGPEHPEHQEEDWDSQNEANDSDSSSRVSDRTPCTLTIQDIEPTFLSDDFLPKDKFNLCFVSPGASRYDLNVSKYFMTKMVEVVGKPYWTNGGANWHNQVLDRDWEAQLWHPLAKICFQELKHLRAGLLSQIPSSDNLAYQEMILKSLENEFNLAMSRISKKVRLISKRMDILNKKNANRNAENQDGLNEKTEHRQLKRDTRKHLIPMAVLVLQTCFKYGLCLDYPLSRFTITTFHILRWTTGWLLKLAMPFRDKTGGNSDGKGDGKAENKSRDAPPEIKDFNLALDYWQAVLEAEGKSYNKKVEREIEIRRIKQIDEAIRKAKKQREEEQWASREKRWDAFFKSALEIASRPNPLDEEYRRASQIGWPSDSSLSRTQQPRLLALGPASAGSSSVPTRPSWSLEKVAQFTALLISRNPPIEQLAAALEVPVREAYAMRDWLEKEGTLKPTTSAPSFQSSAPMRMPDWPRADVEWFIKELSLPHPCPIEDLAEVLGRDVEEAKAMARVLRRQGRLKMDRGPTAAATNVTTAQHSAPKSKLLIAGAMAESTAAPSSSAPPDPQLMPTRLTYPAAAKRATAVSSRPIAAPPSTAPPRPVRREIPETPARPPSTFPAAAARHRGSPPISAVRANVPQTPSRHALIGQAASSSLAAAAVKRQNQDRAGPSASAPARVKKSPPLTAAPAASAPAHAPTPAEQQRPEVPAWMRKDIPPPGSSSGEEDEEEEVEKVSKVGKGKRVVREEQDISNESVEWGRQK